MPCTPPKKSKVTTCCCQTTGCSSRLDPVDGHPCAISVWMTPISNLSHTEVEKDVGPREKRLEMIRDQSGKGAAAFGETTSYPINRNLPARLLCGGVWAPLPDIITFYLFQWEYEVDLL